MSIEGLWSIVIQARDNRLFIFYPTAQETSGLMDLQEEHPPERVILCGTRALPAQSSSQGPGFIHRHRTGCSETWVLGTVGRGPGTQRPGNSVLPSLAVHTFKPAGGRQQREGQHHCRLIQDHLVVCSFQDDDANHKARIPFPFC